MKTLIINLVVTAVVCLMCYHLAIAAATHGGTPTGWLFTVLLLATLVLHSTFIMSNLDER